MSDELEVLKIVAGGLEGAGISYLVSGSIAANCYTEPRMTRDIDIVVRLGKEDIERFAAIFEKEFYLDRKMIESEVARKGMFNLIHNGYVVKVDFIIEKAVDPREDVFARRKKIIVEGVPVWVIGAEDLIIAKLLWSRRSSSEVQLRDVRNLMASISDLDYDYLERRIEDHGLSDIYKELKGERHE
jgi:hypothetical protein